MSLPNARYGLPADERPPEPPLALPKDPVDPVIGLGFEAAAIDEKAAAARGVFYEIFDDTDTMRENRDQALARHHWDALERTAERQLALASHFLNAVRTYKPKRKEAA